MISEVRRAEAMGDTVHLGSLVAVCDFVDVRDVAEAVLAAIGSSPADSLVLNVGSGRAVPVHTVVRDLIRLSGHTGLVVADGDGSPRSADVPWQQADISTIGRELGWKPAISLANSLQDMWQAVAS